MPSLSVGAASKYSRVEQLTLRERLARINTHTLSKKTTRLGQLLKQEAGLVPRVSLSGKKGHIPTITRGKQDYAMGKPGGLDCFQR